MKLPTEIEKAFKAVATMIATRARPAGFAFFIFTEEETILFASNGNRSDVLEMLRTEQFDSEATVIEIGPHTQRRKALEEKCAAIGKRVAAGGQKLALFLFDMHEDKEQPGDVAYYTNHKELRGEIRRFLETQSEKYS